MDVSAVAPFTNVACPGCGALTRVKREFGPYVLLRRYAIGGMSLVFLAQDDTLGREVIVKILNETYSADERRIAAFEEEARITASFSHPHVVRVFTTGRAFDQFFIAMELVPGGHLERKIRDAGRIPEDEVLRLAIQIAEGLRSAQQAGLIHRDIKPGNILLDAHENVKIVDFGLSLVTKGGSAQATEIWATPYYVPPETIEGQAEDFRSDIYAFGATLYHALAGVPPCEEETMATDKLREAKRTVRSLRVVASDISPMTAEVVDRMMAYSAAFRFPSYDDLIRDLDQARRRLAMPAVAPVPSAEPTPRARHNRRGGQAMGVGGMVVAMLALVGGIWFSIWLVTREEAPAGPVAGSGKPSESESFDDGVMPIGNPDLNGGKAIDADSNGRIAREYQRARTAVDAGKFLEAQEIFASLLRDREVQEPTRSWAGVEAVMTAYLGGAPELARASAELCLEHLNEVELGEPGVDAELIPALAALRERAPLVTAEEASEGASVLMARMLAGLKNWEQGLLEQGAKCFESACSVPLDARALWLEPYQKLASDHLADYEILATPEFLTMPEAADECDAVADRLQQAGRELKTRGRAEFHVDSLQVDLRRHARVLRERAASASGAVPAATEILATTSEFAKSADFSGAVGYLSSLPDGKPVEICDALAVLNEAALAFLGDLATDLRKSPVKTDLSLRDGSKWDGVTIDGEGGMWLSTSASGDTRQITWAELEPDSIIALHRQAVRGVADEALRTTRNGDAIAFDWLVGDRVRAEDAAARMIAQSPDFRARWEEISEGLKEIRELEAPSAAGGE